MRTELWLDNCLRIAIHYSTYPVESHFNFLIRAYIPEPYQAGDCRSGEPSLGGLELSIQDIYESISL